jgi:ribonucleoside-triphosphate reductase
MQIEILKRDGKKEKFEAFKIEDAIKKAFKSVNTIYDKSIYFSVLFEIKSKNLKAVEDIQDLIEKELFKSEYFDVMKSFMLYRHLHKIQREQILGLTNDTTYVNSTQTIQEYINGEDWRIKANSNTGYSHAGLINNSAGIQKSKDMLIEMQIFIFMI